MRITRLQTWSGRSGLAFERSSVACLLACLLARRPTAWSTPLLPLFCSQLPLFHLLHPLVRLPYIFKANYTIPSALTRRPTSE